MDLPLFILKVNMQIKRTRFFRKSVNNFEGNFLFNKSRRTRQQYCTQNRTTRQTKIRNNFEIRTHII